MFVLDRIQRKKKKVHTSPSLFPPFSRCILKKLYPAHFSTVKIELRQQLYTCTVRHEKVVWFFKPKAGFHIVTCRQKVIHPASQ